MAAPPRILSLNLGTQTIGMAEFQRAANGGIVLNAFKLTEILSDPSAEAMRLPQTRLAVAEMKDILKLRGGGVNYAISGQNLFARFVKLPTVAEEKVEQIIGFEAQQNVPFPIEEVVWDYQLVGGGKEGTNGNGVAGSQVEVVLVAIKADLLDDLNSAAESSGFRTQIVDAAPIALYNAFRYNYSDLPGCSLLVDLGARTTNLIFIEPGKVFSRSILIGGNTITLNLAKEFNESFAAAEERKKRDGYVSLGGAYADNHNAEIAKASKIIRNAMTKLSKTGRRPCASFSVAAPPTCPTCGSSLPRSSTCRWSTSIRCAT
jgi:type IV pilus assembly protein PilM